MIHRYQALTETRGVTDGLETDWAGFAGRALSAATLTNLLSRHDKQTADAAAQGSAAHYRQALDLLDESDAMIEQARGLRDDLAGSTDVSTLTTWIDRNAAYDAARPPAVRRAAGVEGPRDGPGARGVRRRAGRAERAAGRHPRRSS